MDVERRRKRSSFSSLALQYWLAAVARRTQLCGMVLADSAGLLVASSMAGPEADELAAVAPLLGSTDGNEKTPMSVKQVQVDRTKLYLCAVGEGESERKEQALALAEGGVQRILTTH